MTSIKDILAQSNLKSMQMGEFFSGRRAGVGEGSSGLQVPS